ncbi:MAG TPA: hypothetical protein VGK56_09785, partial [Anaerolineales bacterium]
MSNIVDQVHVAQNLLEVLDETFVTHHGIFLDGGTSLFETLETITAAEASIPVGGKCATLAAQVAHVNFYIEVLEAYILNQDKGKVDWDEIWRRVNTVSPDEWQAYKNQLRETYQRVISMLQRREDWNDE